MTNSFGYAPLHIAAGSGETNAITLLVQHGANVDAQAKDGNTPLINAVLYHQADAVTELLRLGANPNIRNDDGQTPFSLSQHPHAFRPGVPVPQAMPIRTIPSGQGFSSANESTNSIAELLRAHGALEHLPDWNSIEVRRPSANFSRVVFRKGTNDWNRFTLLETVRWAYLGQQGLPFPDLSRVTIVRPSHDSTNETRIVVNVLNNTNGIDCSKDVPLQFGDVVEIPEREHALNAAPVRLTAAQSDEMNQCLRGTVELITPEKKTNVEVNQAWERIGSFLQRPDILAVLTSSSDFAHVKVARHDPDSGKTHEWILDCSDPNHAPDLWLCNGDVIEVSEK